MADYIDREKLLDDLSAAAEHGGMGAIIAQTLMRYVKRQPSADVAPVTSGKKVDVGGFYFRCFECDRLLPFDGNYCPYCGVSLKVGGRDGR